MGLTALILTDLHIGYNDQTIIIYERFLKNIKDSFDIIIISGDIVSHSPIDFEPIAKLIHTIFPDKKILYVNGNHDYWGVGYSNLKMLLDYKLSIAEKYNWHYLEDNPILINGFNIYGFDGWYHLDYFHNHTNDLKNMPINSGYDNLTIDYLRNKNNRIMNSILNMSIDILVTHFPLSLNKNFKKVRKEFTNTLDLIDSLTNVKYLIHGHDHCFKHEKYNNITILNAGSDYNEPKAIIYNFNNNQIKVI